MKVEVAVLGSRRYSPYGVKVEVAVLGSSRYSPTLSVDVRQQAKNRGHIPGRDWNC